MKIQSVPILDHSAAFVTPLWKLQKAGKPSEKGAYHTCKEFHHRGGRASCCRSDKQPQIHQLKQAEVPSQCH